MLLDEDGRVLLIRRRDNGHWEPPGGVLELGERITDGLRREVAEETGLDVAPDALTGVYKNMPRGIIALVFRCRVTGGRLRRNAEVSGFRWATADEVTELVQEAFAVRIQDAIASAGVPPVRPGARWCSRLLTSRSPPPHPGSTVNPPAKPQVKADDGGSGGFPG